MRLVCGRCVEPLVHLLELVHFSGTLMKLGTHPNSNSRAMLEV